VYRRRRALAAAGTAVATVLAVWLVGALIGHGESAPADPVAPVVSNPPPQADPPSPASSSAPTAPPPPGPSTQPVAAHPPGHLPGQPPSPLGLPRRCEPAQLGVVATLDRASHPAGERVELGIRVSNTGPEPCAEEIGRAVRELVVTAADGGARLWSSNDCYDTVGSEVRVLRPGELFEYGLEWRGTASEPGCAEHTRLGPGDYLLTARVAGRSSDPVAFRMT